MSITDCICKCDEKCKWCHTGKTRDRNCNVRRFL